MPSTTRLRDAAVEGLIETAPGLPLDARQLRPVVLSSRSLLDAPRGIHETIAGRARDEIPSRLDPAADRVRRLADRVRPWPATSTRIRNDAPNAEGGNNIDYIVRYNGFADREELYHAVLATEHWTAFIGFFPGLPFMFPLDPRLRDRRAEVQPDPHLDGRGRGRRSAARASRSTRSSRAGGYQLFGRTLPIYDMPGATRRSARTRS